MNKVIFQIGILTFCISIVYFGLQEISIVELLSRSFIIFVGVIAAGVLVVLTVRLLVNDRGSINGTQNQANKSETKIK